MALQVPVDRGYLTLLAHLRQEKSALPFDTIQAAICHYLIHLPPAQPTPTPLTASIVASPLWRAPSLKTYLALGSIFRSAVLLKWTALKAEDRGLFDGSASAELTRWTQSLLAGLKGGDALLCLTISGGLLMGLKDLDLLRASQRLVREVEESIVVAYAEVTHAPTTTETDQWTSEFKLVDERSNERIDLAVLLSAQYFPLVSMEALAALKLTLSFQSVRFKQDLISLCLENVQKAFISGSFLQATQEGTSKDNAEKVVIHADVNKITTLDSFTCVASVCRLLARAIAIFSDTPARLQRKSDIWIALADVIHALSSMARRVEDDWRASPLVDVHDEKQIEPASRKVTEKLWTVLKTQLFSTIMLHQAVLDALLFLHPLPSYSSSSLSSVPSASGLCKAILHTLFSLSFVIASFGGMTAGGNDSRAFTELKRVFYMAVDILSADAEESELLVKELIRSVDPIFAARFTTSHPFVSAKRAFVLACVEQFVPILGDVCIEEDVLPLCELYLGDVSHRETFESAHSVMLSIFAAHAARGGFPEKGNVKGESVDREELNLSRRLVPFYVKSLLQNAKEGRLTTPQFRLAYAALVRSASTGRSPRFPLDSMTSSSSAARSDWRWGSSGDVEEDFAGDPALVWLCVDSLLDAIAMYCPSRGVLISAQEDEDTLMGRNNVGDKASVDEDACTAERSRLALALISLVSNVGLALLPRILQEVSRVIDLEEDARRRRVLIEAVFEEIMERVGDGEKELAMRWWYTKSRKWDVEE